MANPNMIIRVAATIAELKANLAEGKSQIETTTAAMAKLATSLSGEKLMQSAHNITAAVNQIGGASKLTDAEAARVNATLTRALEKYAALGKEAPGAMVALAAATKQVEAPTEGLSTKMVALGSFIGTMAANAVAALGRLALAGVRAVASEINELITGGSKLAGMENSFRTLAASMGEAASVMLGAMRTGTRGLVSDMDLMQAANKAMLLGLPVTGKEMGELAQTATVLGRAMGLTATQSFNDLIVALGRSSPMILDNLGLSVKVGEANEVMAASIGKTAAQLTDAEKKTAFYNAAMEAARAKVLALGEGHLTLGDNIAKAGIWWTNFKNDLAITIAKSPVVAAATDAMGKALGEAFGSSQAARVAAMNTGVSKLAIFLADAASVGVSTAKYIAEGFYLLRGVLFGVLEAVGNIITTFLQGNARIAEFAASIPLVGRAWTGVAANARVAADVMGSITSSFKATGDEAFDSMGKVGASMDGANEKIAAMRVAMVAASQATEQAKPVQEAFTKATNEQAAALRNASAAAVAFEKDFAAFNAQANQSLPIVLGNVDKKFRDTLPVVEALKSEMVVTAEVIGEVGEAAAAASTASTTATTTAAQGWQGVAQQVTISADAIREWIALMKFTNAANAILSRNSLFTSASQYQQIAALPTPRASGGPVSAGSPYMVGERGPEMFVPERSGTIVPNGGGSNITVAPVLHFHGPVLGSSLELDAAVSGSILNIFKSGAVSIPAGVG